MFISSLRWVVALGAAAAAVVALAVPAGASTGPRWTSPEQAGYTATGARFQQVDALVFLRNPAHFAGMVAKFGHGIQLRSSGLVVSAGVTASTSGTSYTFHATIYDRSTHRVIAANPNPKYRYGAGEEHQGLGPPLPSGKYGGVGIRYDRADGSLYMSAWTLPPVGMGFDEDFVVDCSYAVSPQSFTQARVGTEFGSSPWDASYSYATPATAVKVARYAHVRLITYNNHESGLWSWWVHHKLVADTRQQRVAVPHNLYNGGRSFQTWLIP